MNKDTLKALGIEDDDLIKKIIIEHGKDIEKFKNDLATNATEVAALQGQIAEANKTIEAFKGMNVDEIKASAEKWQAEAEKAQQDAEAAIAQVRFDYALDAALQGEKARNVKAVRALVDTSKLTFKDGNLVGLEEQLKTIRADNEYLFDDTQLVPKIVAKGVGRVTSDDPIVRAARAAAGLGE